METIVKNAALADVLQYSRSPLDKLVARMAKKDPLGYSHPRMTPEKARITAMLQDNLLKEYANGKWGGHLNDDARKLFGKYDMLYDQRAKEHAKETGEAVRIFDTTQESDIATIATQTLPVISRTVSENPIFELVDTFVMTGPQANIVYFDVKYDTAGGAYSVGDRVDLNDDPTYSDRTDCTASGRQLKLTVTKELTTALEKVLGGKICVTAMQDADSQFNIALDEKLAEEIQRQMSREWARLVTDDVRTMAGKTASWSSTAPGPYSSLNTNEWRKVLVETLITLDASIRTAVYEPTEWLLTTPTTGAIMERLQRGHAATPMGMPAQGSVQLAAGEMGPYVDRWKYYQDAFFAANTIVIGRKSFNLVPNSPYYFLPWMAIAKISMLFYPLTQILEMAGETRCARKMVEPNAFGRLTVS